MYKLNIVCSNLDEFDTLFITKPSLDEIKERVKTNFPEYVSSAFDSVDDGLLETNCKVIYDGSGLKYTISFDEVFFNDIPANNFYKDHKVI